MAEDGHTVEAQKLETQGPQAGIPALFGLNPVSNFLGFLVGPWSRGFRV